MCLCIIYCVIYLLLQWYYPFSSTSGPGVLCILRSAAHVLLSWFIYTHMKREIEKKREREPLLRMRICSMLYEASDSFLCLPSTKNHQKEPNTLTSRSSSNITPVPRMHTSSRSQPLLVMPSKITMNSKQDGKYAHPYRTLTCLMHHQQMLLSFYPRLVSSLSNFVFILF